MEGNRAVSKPPMPEDASYSENDFQYLRSRTDAGSTQVFNNREKERIN